MSTIGRIIAALMAAAFMAAVANTPLGERGLRQPPPELPKFEMPKPITIDPLWYPSGEKPTCQYPGFGQGSYRLSKKQCSACRRTVPLSSQRGERCPHCQAYWSFERTVHKSSSDNK